ncbi:MAG: DedA family protein [Candidatus Moranbacteria bacterium]|nr:DedA family protein [Candidatus Moranbacteria bacterium]
MAIEVFLLTFRYPAIFAGSFIEGPAVMVLTGFLLRLGYFHPMPAFILLLLGDLVGDFMWYGLGYFKMHQTVKKVGKYFDVTDKIIEKVNKKFRHHEGKILFGSKLTTGFGFSVAIMLAAGMARVPLKKFAALCISGSMIWTAALMAIGYFFGNVYVHLEKGFRIVFIATLLIIIAAAIYGFGRHMRKRFLKNNQS